MLDNSKKETIYGVMNGILKQFQSDFGLEQSSNKAILAKLRNSMGREISYSADVWKYVFYKMPEKFLGTGKKITREENAIFSSLQLYALHQQGREKSVHLSPRDYEANQEQSYFRKNIGDALRELRRDEQTEAIDRRFNSMITSSTIDELKIHLRHLINIFKAKSDEKIDYAALANDLFWFQNGKEEGIRLSWGRSYYRYIKQEDKNEK